jgi:hypothetical protein
VTADGVIPQPAERARVAEIGSVNDLSGRPLKVAVNGSVVIIAGCKLNEARCETFAQLFVRAVWLAARGWNDASTPSASR